MAIDTPPDIGYSLEQEKQITSLRNQVVTLKEILGKNVVDMVKDISRNRLTIKTIKQIRDVCNKTLYDSAYKEKE